MHPEINVIIMDNPYGIKGSTNPNKDGSYTIIINAHLSFEDQKKAYKHELEHILNGDFDKLNVNEIEKEAHNLETSVKLHLI